MKKVIFLWREMLLVLWRGLGVAVSVGFVLALWLGFARVLMLCYYWPAVGGANLWAELADALLMGMRFDLKVSASAGLLLFIFLGWGWRLTHRILTLYSTAFAVISVVNFYYYGFYKLPIDAVIFGLVDDDTIGVLRTIWLDFPIVQVVFVLIAAVYSANWVALRTGRYALAVMQANLSRRQHVVWAPVLLLLVMLLAKGTLKGSPLDLDNTTATSKPFLNSVVPNGVSALYNAWNTYRNSADIGDVNRGLKAMGFHNFQEAAKVLGIQATTAETMQRALLAQGHDALNGKNLVFVQMESWSAEPFRYQSQNNDVMASLKQQMPKAWFFDNFDSVQNGTHPALEAILFSTPVTPITSGKYRNVQLDWSVPHTFKRAGYDTLFVTSGQSGWRELNRVLTTQGFDEVIDAAALRTQYPDAQGGVWGVWDSYMFRAIQDRLARQPKERPLFIYAMSTTNHPPYELPADYKPFAFDTRQWPGDQSSETLIPNLQTYRYANDELAKFVTNLESTATGLHTLVAATGDHNARSFGQYVTPERQVLRYQVPFVIWGAETMACRGAMHQPASHLDMFPTLFPLLGIHEGYLVTGRNLADCSSTGLAADATSLTFLGQVRTSDALWQLGNSKTLACQPLGSVCNWPAEQDSRARARVALMDWNVRHHILRVIGKK